MKMKTCHIIRAFAGLLVWTANLLPVSSLAELTVAAPFTDNAVLQRDIPVPVWGKADAGATVTVEFAGRKKTAIADSQGNWKVLLEPLAAMAVPHELTIRSEGETAIRCKNIQVGEVWICSGQSNMQMGFKKIPDIAALLPDARNIRCFNVERTVAFEEQDRCQGRWEGQAPNSAVAFAFAYSLEKAHNVPIGIILTAWGSSSIEAWMPRDMTNAVPHFRTIMREFDADSETRERIAGILDGDRPWSRSDDVFLRRQPNILYNAMMHPLAPYACRGLIWYQGERNTQSMFGMPKEPWYSRNSGMLKYGDALQQWIQRYREQWDNPAMHFMVVMLPGYHGNPLQTGPQLGAEHPATHSWAWMRESQLKALDLAHTSVVNTIDLGDIENIHPKDKLPVGQRLALLARRDALGEDIEAEGPVMCRVDKKGGRLVVHFDHSGGLTTVDGKPPTGFWVADNSESWVKAEASLEGSTVVLQSPECKRPLYVRYAFAGKPKVNLINAAGLPAYPFRTDRFQP